MTPPAGPADERAAIHSNAQWRRLDGMARVSSGTQNGSADHGGRPAGREELMGRIREMQERFIALNARDDPSGLLNLSLTMQQLKTLIVLSMESPLAAHRLARSLGVGTATVTGIVDRLVDRGLVTRTEDPADRRVRRIALSEAGTRLIDTLRGENEARSMRLLRRLDDEALRALAFALDALYRAAVEEAAEQEGGAADAGPGTG
ncbi:MarR family winged helix-turn-helix transcriptional regulator [Allonocardiopsis opalescens]|uniref:DNA-binding MarR family transcriptional regulator n=1 Tax=Allonocardiopsis opalescens TaxID=1144618 RepID=A0A2T0PUW9_9ACTN|nr:MarR family transcriptional regulator [Allonocardiopsis opalescens]PRX92526.1 DNA-binding MarR family transcriptional regulator [Allonocardiopsis opalescens]